MRYTRLNIDKKERLRSLYKVDEVLQDECLVFFKEKLPYSMIADSVRKEIDLLRLLVGQGFTEAELKKIAARIAQETGATIIFC